VLLPNLVNLERIEVMLCEKMEEIIGTTDEESSNSNPGFETRITQIKTNYEVQFSINPLLKEKIKKKIN
jgi:hypothetical protein